VLALALPFIRQEDWRGDVAIFHLVPASSDAVGGFGIGFYLTLLILLALAISSILILVYTLKGQRNEFS